MGILVCGNPALRWGNKGINAQDVGVRCARQILEKNLRIKNDRRQLPLYLEGCGFRRIARILTQIYRKLFHNQTIIKWVKKAAISLPERKNHAPIDVLEMDELYTFVKKL